MVPAPTHIIDGHSHTHYRAVSLHLLHPRQDLVPEVGPPIKAGLRMAADMDFLSVLFRFDTTVSYDGVAVAARVQGVPVSMRLQLAKHARVAGHANR